MARIASKGREADDSTIFLDRRRISLCSPLNFVFVLSVIVICTYIKSAWADCAFSNPDANPMITFTLPAKLVVEPDTAIGTIIYAGETAGESHGLDCNGSVQLREGYTVLTDADYSGVLPGVYKTTVPGIGFRAARAENKTAAFTSENIITPWHYIGMTGGSWVTYDSTYHVGVELVVIGTVESGTLDTSKFNADYQMGSLMAAKLRFAPTTVDVRTNTCNLVSKDINVLMDTVTSGSLSEGLSPVLTDDRFKIEVKNCAAGTHIDYKFTSAGSTGVSEGNILNIASGDGAASGVGIQILNNENQALDFDRDYTGIDGAGGEGVETIPFKARYVKTGTVKGGKVEAVATFEVNYR